MSNSNAISSVTNNKHTHSLTLLCSPLWCVSHKRSDRVCVILLSTDRWTGTELLGVGLLCYTLFCWHPPMVKTGLVLPDQRAEHLTVEKNCTNNNNKNKWVVNYMFSSTGNDMGNIVLTWQTFELLIDIGLLNRQLLGDVFVPVSFWFSRLRTVCVFTSLCEWQLLFNSDSVSHFFKIKKQVCLLLWLFSDKYDSTECWRRMLT